MLSKYEQSTNLIQIAYCCFRAFPAFVHFVQISCWILIAIWNIASAREWYLTAQIVLRWYCAVAHLKREQWLRQPAIAFAC